MNRQTQTEAQEENQERKETTLMNQVRSQLITQELTIETMYIGKVLPKKKEN